jgi:hypothetical protein
LAQEIKNITENDLTDTQLENIRNILTDYSISSLSFTFPPESKEELVVLDSRYLTVQ